MELRVAAVVVGFLVVLLCHSGTAIKCYVCNSGEHYHGEKCESGGLTDDLLKNCTDEGILDGKEYVDMCRKFIQEVDGETRTVRSCATHGRPERGCIDRTGTYKIKLRYCECQGKDGCNAAVPVAGTASLSLLTAFLLAWILA